MMKSFKMRARGWAVAGALAAGLATAAGGAVAQDMPKTQLKVVGAWGNLLQYKNFEQPFWTKELAEKWPKAAEFLKKANFSNAEIAKAAMMVDVDGMTPEDAAKKWIADNETIWKAWVN